MTTEAVLDIAVQALTVAAKLSAPVLVTALVIGLAVSLVQSMTQVQEVTLSFVPKALGVAIALVVTGQWMISTVVTFTTDLYTRLPALIGG
ncbi:MAG: flagellar export apparatus protein FliQ [Cellulomonas sp. 14-74-6]|jgi:flagellar biosynthetic protein FliQ|nr:MAG: flagellar export apparatus protein FliQ [Cellulomonas sp. 14-74-6]